MGADIERESIDPKSNFISRCLHHQGSVLLSSDLNEHGAIFQYYLRQFIIDLVGESWRAKEDEFLIQFSNERLQITKGNFYIHGILCANPKDCFYDGNNTKEREIQPYSPPPESVDAGKKLSDLSFIVYLECWERHVNSIQRPEIKEIALGGADTSSRMEIAWQVRVLTEDQLKENIAPIMNALQELQKLKGENGKPSVEETNLSKQTINSILADTDKGIIKDKGQKILDALDIARPSLRVWAKKPSDANEPCSISADSKYRGFENQLYRVEIHEPGASPNSTFKWSRENASVTFKILPDSIDYTGGKEPGKITLTIEKLGPDRRYGLCVGDWVELTSNAIEFGQQVLPLARVTNIDANLGDLILSIVTGGTTTSETIKKCTMLRRWDQNALINNINADGTIKIQESTRNDYDKEDWILLEHGIKVQFQPGGNYRHGDYWLIPARVSSGDIMWPQIENGGELVPDKCPPNGIKRYRAILGVCRNGKIENIVL